MMLQEDCPDWLNLAAIHAPQGGMHHTRLLRGRLSAQTRSC
jgi:hypothetical protein